jgi:hypothetical protein
MTCSQYRSRSACHGPCTMAARIPDWDQRGHRRQHADGRVITRLKLITQLPLICL